MYIGTINCAAHRLKAFNSFRMWMPIAIIATAGNHGDLGLDVLQKGFAIAVPGAVVPRFEDIELT